MQKVTVIAANILTLVLLYSIATREDVSGIELIYCLIKVPILVWDASIILYKSEEHVAEHFFAYLIRVPKRLILYYEYKYVISQIRQIPDNSDFEIERHRDSKIVRTIMPYFDGTKVVDMYNKHVSTKHEQKKKAQQEADREYLRRLRNFGK